jgi:hypothetical protein
MCPRHTKLSSYVPHATWKGSPGCRSLSCHLCVLDHFLFNRLQIVSPQSEKAEAKKRDEGSRSILPRHCTLRFERKVSIDWRSIGWELDRICRLVLAACVVARTLCRSNPVVRFHESALHVCVSKGGNTCFVECSSWVLDMWTQVLGTVQSSIFILL